ncbi:acyloxyacyl hydrolase [Caenimonas koreensis]|uniref:acyloxyacyl hydrolase n=1 Tax=Caenimonas koreensis TaxID=367474 RepID=UPI003784CFAC
MRIKLLPLAACLAVASGAAHADWSPSGFFFEGAVADHSGYSFNAGLVWPWNWRYETAGGLVTLQTEASLGQWSGKSATGRVSFTQVVLQPIFRYHFDKSATGFFVEGGIGLSYTDKVYITASKTFSTRFNFADTIGTGYSFGAQEVGLRLTHYSNAGIKHPNPGENFLQLRYGVKF